MSEDIELLDEATKVVKVAGKDIALTRFKVGQLPAVMRFVKRFSNGFGIHPDSDPFSIFDALEEHAEELVQLMSKLTGLSIDELNELDIAEFTLLTEEVIKLNADFFKKKIPSLLSQINQHLS